jgi:hypothetical protein
MPGPPFRPDETVMCDLNGRLQLAYVLEARPSHYKLKLEFDGEIDTEHQPAYLIPDWDPKFHAPRDPDPFQQLRKQRAATAGAKRAAAPGIHQRAKRRRVSFAPNQAEQHPFQLPVDNPPPPHAVNRPPDEPVNQAPRRAPPPEPPPPEDMDAIYQADRDLANNPRLTA